MKVSNDTHLDLSRFERVRRGPFNTQEAHLVDTSLFERPVQEEIPKTGAY